MSLQSLAAQALRLLRGPHGQPEEGRLAPRQTLRLLPRARLPGRGLQLLPSPTSLPSSPFCVQGALLEHLLRLSLVTSVYGTDVASSRQPSLTLAPAFTLGHSTHPTERGPDTATGCTPGTQQVLIHLG